MDKYLFFNLLYTKSLLLKSGIFKVTILGLILSLDCLSGRYGVVARQRKISCDGIHVSWAFLNRLS